jgi:hypothetical protein
MFGIDRICINSLCPGKGFTPFAEPPAAKTEIVAKKMQIGAFDFLSMTKLKLL